MAENASDSFERPQRNPPRGPSRPLSPRDDAILRAVHSYHFLSVDQLTRLYYSPGSLKYVRDVLKRLADEGYLLRLRLPSSGLGATPFIYTLARRGINHLAAAGYSQIVRFRPSEQAEQSYLHLTHTLAVNDFLIGATLLAEEATGVVLAEMQHERALKTRPVKVTTARGERMGVIPDAYLDFHLRGRERMSLILELDRGTVDQAAVKRKLRGLLAFAAGPYQRVFGTDSLSMVWATTAGVRRAQLLRMWTEQVLTDFKEERHANLFLFAPLPPEAISPRALFLSPIWSVPFSPTPVPLLEL